MAVREDVINEGMGKGRTIGNRGKRNEGTKETGLGKGES